MKKFLIIIGILVVAGIGLNYWGQRKATAIITQQVQRAVKPVIANAENVVVKNSPITLRGVQSYHFDSMEVTGQDLIVSKAMNLASAAVVLHDVDITGNPPKPTHVGSVTFEVGVTDTEMTQFIRKQGTRKVERLAIPLGGVTVSFNPTHDVTCTGRIDAPYGMSTPFTLQGAFVPVQDGKGIDFQVATAQFPNLPALEKELPRSFSITDALPKLLGSTFKGKVTEIVVQDGLLILRGEMDVAD